MADTLLNVRRRVRLLTDDMDPNDYALDSDRLNTVIESRMHLMAQEVGLGASWVTGAVTLVASTWQYTLPTSVQYERITAVQFAAQNWLLDRVTPTEMLALHDGAGTTSGDPTHYALFEDTSQQINLWVFPIPNAAGTLNALRAQVPAALSTDATNIPFGSPLLRALEKGAAVDAVLLMDEEARTERKATLDAAGKWDKEIARAIKLERVRIANLRRSDTVPQRWV